MWKKVFKNIEKERNSISENITTAETDDAYSEIKYTANIIGKGDNLVVFEFDINENPIVLYTYTNDYLAYLEINEIFVPFFNEYFIEYDDSSTEDVFKLLDGVRVFKKSNEYIIMFPIFSNEFTLFQLIGFN